MSELQSMTGFASTTQSVGGRQLSCEMRSVNGKSLDIRLRLPSGLEAMEAEIKKRISAKIARGNIQVSISVDASSSQAFMSIDEEAFVALAKQASRLAQASNIAPPTTDGILAVRGIVSGDDAAIASVEIDDEFRDALLATIEQTVENLLAMRQNEGASLQSVLATHLHTIAEQTIAARDDAASRPDAIKAKLENQLSALLECVGEGSLDPDRLHAEAAILATKADIREEIDRLHAHVAAASDLLAKGGPVGRKLDFLAQEFNRETNTICSKSTSATLTATGLALKAVIDQFREQVQNLQ